MTISHFPEITGKCEPLTLDNALNWIRNGKYRPNIDLLRKYITEGNDKKAGAIKSKLPAFTPSGLFNGTHRKEDIIKYSSFVILDIDKVGLEKVGELKNQAVAVEFTYAAFISPSGNGLKIIVKTDSTKETHEIAFNRVAKYYEQQLGVEIDKSGKDYSRLCFLSYDPELFVNENTLIFQIQSFTEIPKFGATSTTLTDDLFQNVITFTDTVNQYYPSNRNNYVYLLANNLNRIGITKSEAEVKISLKYPDLGNKEIKASVGSAYNHTAEHGIFTPEYINSVSSVRLARIANTRLGTGTPFIPDDVYKNLPMFLKKGTDAFDLLREKDVFLTGALTILSGCFNSVYGVYDRREFHPNVNCFIIAPPASGKGVLNSARDLAQRIHFTIVSEYENALESPNVNASEIPRSHFIPADSSASAVKRNLKFNLEKGTICETEADTLSGTLQQDWGNYSDLIRKAFQHEPVTFIRVGKGDEIKTGEINRPKLSICLSGTPSQVPKLLQSTEDGLFSRIIFYTYRNDDLPVFKNVFEKGNISNLTFFFEKQSDELNAMYKKAERENHEFKLTQEQEEKFVARFDKTVKRIHFEFGEETRSIVNRLGLISFRLAMILTILRNLEKEVLQSQIICNDIDFTSSMLLADVYLEHALEVYKSLPRSRISNTNTEAFYAFLPKEFKHAEAVKIGKTVAEISEKTVTNYLRELKEAGKLKQPKTYGTYYK